MTAVVVIAAIRFGDSDPLGLIVGGCAVAIAAAAWWVAVQESRRNNAVMLRLLECSCKGCNVIGENDGKLFHRFELVIRNRAISLYGVVVTISFRGSDGRGRLTMVIPQSSGTEANVSEHTEFARGMTGTFALTSYHLDDGDVGFLCDLKDARQQDAWIQVFTQGYHAYSFRIGGVKDTMRVRWNVAAGRINKLFWRQRGSSADGTPLIETREPLPNMVTVEANLSRFIKALQQRSKAGGNSIVLSPK